MSKRAAPEDSHVQEGKKAKNMASPMQVDEIDEDLHSRQLAVYGKESMKRMANASVLLLGLKGLGIEVGAYIIQSSLSLRGFVVTFL